MDMGLIRMISFAPRMWDLFLSTSAQSPSCSTIWLLLQGKQKMLSNQTFSHIFYIFMAKPPTTKLQLSAYY